MRPDERPAVAFDVIGTLFDLGSVRDVLQRHGLPAYAPEVWLAASLRDFYAAAMAGRFEPLPRVLEAELPRTLALFGIDTGQIIEREALRAFRRLALAPGARRCCAMLASRGIRLLALTNGGADMTREMLEREGVLTGFEQVLSVEEVRRPKPWPGAYGLARRHAGGDLWMVSAHAWDVMGAAHAGWHTLWITRTEREWLEVWPRPELIARDLEEAAERLLHRLTFAA